MKWKRLGLGVLSLLLAACLGCRTVTVIVEKEEGYPGRDDCEIYWLDRTGTQAFNEALEAENKVSDWWNSAQQEQIEKFKAQFTEPSRQKWKESLNLGDKWPAPYDRPRKSLKDARSLLILLNSGETMVSPTSYLLLEKEDLLHWPYWRDLTFTAGRDGLRKGRAEREKKGEKK